MSNESHVLVCVTGQRSCERLIEEGARIALEAEAELSVVHVAKRGNRFLGSESEAEALEHLFRISKAYDADMMLLRNDDVVNTLAAHARRIGARVVVIGGRPIKGGNHLTRALQNALPDLDVRTVISEEA